MLVNDVQGLEVGVREGDELNTEVHESDCSKCRW